MVTMSPLATDSRVDREATALVEAGLDVAVVGLGPAPDDRSWEPVSIGGHGSPGRDRVGRHWDVARALLLSPHRRRTRARFVEVAGARVRELAPDVIHAHDLPGLEAADPTRPDVPVVYDSHEWWSGRRLVGVGSRLERRRDLGVERRLGAASAVVITVSSPIARRIEAFLGVPVRVVRNTFPVSKAPPPGAFAYLAYAGNVAPGRDLSTVAAAARLGGFDLRVKGRVVAGVPGLEVAVEPAGTVAEAGDFLRAGGIAVVSLTDESENHRLALPNKLFQAVAEGVPVVAADLPAIREVVTEHGLGALYRPGDPGSLAEAVAAVAADHAGRVAAVLQAREALGWDVDAAVLREAYRAIGPPGDGSGRLPNDR